MPGILAPPLPVVKHFEQFQYHQSNRYIDLLDDVELGLTMLEAEDNEIDRSVTGITKPRIRKLDINHFELWVKRVGQRAAGFPGHLTFTVLSPEKPLIDSAADTDVFEFICILKFDNFDNLKTWLYSDVRTDLITEAKQFIQNADDEDYWNIQSRDVAKLDLTSWIKKAPPKQHRPPPKWKSYAVIVVEVSLVNFCYFYIQVFPGIYKTFPNYALAEFFSITTLVLPLLFFVSPCFSYVLTPWLELPRYEPKWEPLSFIMDTLNDGFTLFEVRQTTTKEDELVTRLKQVETKMDRLKSLAQRQRRQIGVLVQHLRTHLPGNEVDNSREGTMWTSTLFSRPSMAPLNAEADVSHHSSTSVRDPEVGMPIDYIPAATDPFVSFSNTEAVINLEKQPSDTTVQRHVSDANTIRVQKQPSVSTVNAESVTIGETYHVKWEYSEAFEEFVQTNIRKSLSSVAGFKSIDMVFHHDEDVGQTYTLIYRFQNYNTLQQWLSSDLCKSLRAEIQPFVEENVHMTPLSQGRSFIHDSFSDLLVSRGASIPTLPPPLWRTILLTLGGAYLAVWPSSFYLAPLIYKSFSFRLRLLAIFFATCVNFFLASYFGIPFVSFMFGQWLRAPRKPNRTGKSPSTVAIVLDRGLASPRQKIGATVLYFMFLGLLAGYRV